MTAVEFAIVAPVLVFITLGIIEMGLDLYVDATVETAVQRASRLGITTLPPTNMSMPDAVAASIKSTMSVWTSRALTFSITNKSYPSYVTSGGAEPYTDVGNVGHYVQGDPFVDINKNGVWDADQGVNGTGGYGDVVSYTVTITMPSFTGMPELVGIPSLSFTRTFIVQNETSI